MDGSSELNSRSTADGRHLADIERARRQFERATIRTPGSAGSGPGSSKPGSGAAWLADSLPGYDIGPEIHRGGQGVVYRSVQRGTQRDVAIKVMRDGPFGGPREKARFEREIQILGRLKHPNIVTIHESGASANGFYFVMDYIPGQTLDAYAAESKLDVRETLALFAKICRAVNVAHLRGVIHRDLKPANIRVDPGGEPHVLDFGLAKVDSDESSAAPAVQSMTGQFIGSLPWASPEQVEGQSGELDIRTDVYSLGVILFQVLTRRFPYELSGNMRQMVENICRSEPPVPSSIRAEIGGEVDAIVLKCLHKEKEQRYQSAGDIAGDIERYLAGEPIEAKRDSGWYVLSKQVRKHRIAFAITGVLLVVIAAALATSLTFWRRAVRDRDAARGATAAAVAARDDAKKQQIVAASVTNFLTNDVLLQLDPYNTQGTDLTARALFDKAASDVEAGAFKEQPQVEFEVRGVLGIVYLWMTDFKHSESQLRSALAIARREFGDEDEKTLVTMRRLGSALARQGKNKEAEPLLRKALEVQSRTLGDDHQATLMARSTLAEWFMDASRPEEAEAEYRKVLEARTRLQGPENVETLAVRGKLAEALGYEEKFAEAEPLFREVIRQKRRIHGDQHPETLLDLMHFADMLLLAGRPAEAKPLAEEACHGLVEHMGRGRESTLSSMLVLSQIHQKLGDSLAAEQLLREALADYRAAGSVGYQVVEILRQLSGNLVRQGKLAEGEKFLRDALQVQERVGGHVIDRLRILSQLISVLGEEGRAADAVGFAEECVRVGRQLYGDDDGNTILFLNNYAFALMGSKRWAEAEAQFRSALASKRRTSATDDGITLNLMHNLAMTLGNQGKNEERESLLRAVLAGRRKLIGDDDPFTLKTMHALGAALMDAGKLEEAEPLYREAVTRGEKVWPHGHYLTEHFRCGLGVCLTTMKRYAEAEPVLLRAYEHDLDLIPANHPNRVDDVQKLINLYEAWGRPAQADEWRAKLPTAASAPATSQPSGN